VLDFRKTGIIVLLTDGEETCGRSPCDLGKQLHTAAEQLTVHVIAIRVKGLSAWTGEQSILETKCLAEQNNGLYIPVETEDDLIAAFDPRLPRALAKRSALSGSPGANKNRSALGIGTEKVIDKVLTAPLTDPSFWFLTGLLHACWGQRPGHKPKVDVSG
jgi:hypothetical protein